MQSVLAQLEFYNLTSADLCAFETVKDAHDELPGWQKEEPDVNTRGLIEGDRDSYLDNSGDCRDLVAFLFEKALNVHDSIEEYAPEALK